MLAGRLISNLTTRTFSQSIPLLSRFGRHAIRNRIKEQELRSLRQKFQYQSNKIAADSIPCRPVSDLRKVVLFTIGTGVAAYTIAISVEVLTRRDPQVVVQSYFDNWLKQTLTFQPRREDEEDLDLIEMIKQKYKSMTVGQMNVAALIAMNFAVFVGWRIPQMRAFMQRYFTNSFASRSLCLPMVLSAFSHQSFIHFCLNMYVMTTFSSMIIDKFLGAHQFWAFYVTSAAMSSMLSLTEKALTRSPIRALGASGAILAVLTYTCMQIPEGRLSLIFIPNFDFSAQNAVYGIIAIDLIGLIFRFRLFDHAAHLGGSLFGVFYALYGQNWIWNHFGYHIENFIIQFKK